MRLRPYIPSSDFDAIKNWVTDEKTHALWSAKHAAYPLERNAFDKFLADMYTKHGDCPLLSLQITER